MDAALFRSKYFRLGISSQNAPADRPRRPDDRASDLPADGARVRRLEAGLSLAPTLAEHVRQVALIAGKQPRESASSSKIISSRASTARRRRPHPDPIVPQAHCYSAMAVPLLIASSGLRLLVSRLDDCARFFTDRGERVGGPPHMKLRSRLRSGSSFRLTLAGADHAHVAARYRHPTGEVENSASSPTRGRAGRKRPRRKRAKVLTTPTSASCSPGGQRRRGRDPPHRRQGAARAPSRSRCSSRCSRRCSASSTASG